MTDRSTARLPVLLGSFQEVLYDDGGAEGSDHRISDENSRVFFVPDPLAADPQFLEPRVEMTQISTSVIRGHPRIEPVPPD